ncbi:MAG: hypothetical protein WKF50_05065 [Nocardioides sp.]
MVLREALATLLIALPFGAGIAVGVDAEQQRPEFRFTDPAIVESSGLALVDGLVVTVNDSGDEARVFAVDPATGDTVGVTRWGAEPTDIEALAPGEDGTVWVGDIGDNSAGRDTVTVTRVPVGRGDQTVEATAYELGYPGGASDAEALLAHPETGRLYVVTKGVFGAVVHAAPTELREDAVNRLRPVGEAMSIVTDGAFLPDGEHVVLRDYGRAVIYEFPSFEVVGEVQLPAQQQGEGIAAAGDDRVLVSSEGQQAPVFAVALPGLADAEPSATPSSSSREGQELPQQPLGDRDPTQWLLGVGLAVVALLVLVRALRPR